MFLTKRAGSWLAILLLSGAVSGCRSAQTVTVQTTAPPEGLSMIWPDGLRPGDTIMFVAPAGDLQEERIRQAKSRLEARGYKVVMRQDLFAKEGYLAGTDKRRAKELMQAFLDPDVKAVFSGRGGYGTMRILDRLDYKKIRANPKIFIGFSDITGLHLALNRQAGLVTFHSPTSFWRLDSETEGMRPFTQEYLLRAVVDDRAATNDGYTIEIPEDAPRPVALGKGAARGRLAGGNLSMISALEGTPFSVDTRDAILLLEDTREAPYRIDRMLKQFELAGKLETLRGAVLGQFTRNYDREEDQMTEDPRADELSHRAQSVQRHATARCPGRDRRRPGHPPHPGALVWAEASRRSSRPILEGLGVRRPSYLRPVFGVLGPPPIPLDP